MSLFTAVLLLLLLRLMFGPRVKGSTALIVSVLLLGSGALLWVTGNHRPSASGPLEQKLAQQGLEHALRNDDLESIRHSLADGADARNPDGAESYFMLARSIQARQLLLTHGASPDGLPNQEPPLLAAWGDDDLALFQWLLAVGADPERAIDAEPALLVVTLFNQNDPAPWLQPLLDRGVDLNRELPGGLSTLDELLLSAVHPDWVDHLRRAGARHALLLDRGEAMPPEHPAMAHVRHWLEVKEQPDWPDLADRFVLPDIQRHGCEYKQPTAANGSLVGRIEGNQALVEVVGTTDYGPRRSMIGLRRISAEEEPAGPAERPIEPAASGGLWRISGCAQDRRYPGEPTSQREKNLQRQHLQRLAQGN